MCAFVNFSPCCGSDEYVVGASLGKEKEGGRKGEMIKAVMRDRKEDLKKVWQKKHEKQ